MTNNSPRGKFLTFKTVGVVIFFPGKKGITIVICHLGGVEIPMWIAKLLVNTLLFGGQVSRID